MNQTLFMIFEDLFNRAGYTFQRIEQPWWASCWYGRRYVVVYGATGSRTELHGDQAVYNFWSNLRWGL